MSEPRVLPAFAEASMGDPVQRLSDAGWGRIEEAAVHTQGQVDSLTAFQQATWQNDVVKEMGAVLLDRQKPRPELHPSWAHRRQPMVSLLDQAIQHVEARNERAISRLHRKFEKQVERECVAEGLIKPPIQERKVPEPGGWKRMREQFSRERDRGHER